MMPKSLRMRLLLGGTGLLALGLAVGWLMADDGLDAAKLVAPAERWPDPALRPSDPAKALASLTQRQLWGEAAAVAIGEPAKAGTPAWRLSGVVTDSGQPLAVILVTEGGTQAAHVLYGKPGDALPDGSHIVAITRAMITVSGENGPRQIKLFSPN
ncbi:MAG: hypothetical protein QOJ54_1220 [Aliidongia sp.]|jgi:hypothetical protein|nr:hypothetical protein [Aliidongia sp.]